MMLLREKLWENIKSQMSLTKNAEHELLSLQSNVPWPYEVVHLQKERLVLLSLQFEKILQRLESPQNWEKKS